MWRQRYEKWRHLETERPHLLVGERVIITSYLELPDYWNETWSTLLSIPETKDRERIQSYSGTIISKHGRTGSSNSTITVRKVGKESGVEKIFVIDSPWIKDIKILGQSKIRRSKLYYLRTRKGKSARLKRRP